MWLQWEHKSSLLLTGHITGLDSKNFAIVSIDAALTLQPLPLLLKIMS